MWKTKLILFLLLALPLLGQVPSVTFSTQFPNPTGITATPWQATYTGVVFHQVSWQQIGATVPVGCTFDLQYSNNGTSQAGTLLAGIPCNSATNSPLSTVASVPYVRLACTSGTCPSAGTVVVAYTGLNVTPSSYTYTTLASVSGSGTVATLTIATGGNFPSAFQSGTTLSITNCSNSGFNVQAAWTGGGGGNPTMTYNNGTSGSATGCLVNLATTSGGTINGVTAGTNLTGGGSSGNVTLNLANPITANTTGNAATATNATNATSAAQLNGGVIPTSKAVVGTNSAGQIIDESTSTLPNNISGNAATATSANNATTANNLAGPAALPNGTSGTTQAHGDSSADLATDLYVQQNIGAVPSLTQGQEPVGNALGVTTATNPACINALALLSGSQTIQNVDWGTLIRNYWSAAGSGACVDMRWLQGTTHSWITSPWGNVAAGNALSASFQGSIILPCNATGIVSSTFITPFQGQFIWGCTGAQLNSYGYTFQLCNSNVGQTCPNSAPNFPTGDGSPALTAVAYGIPNGNPSSPGLIAPKTCNSAGTGTMTNASTYCPPGSYLSTSGTTLTCVGCAWPTGQNSVLSNSVLSVPSTTCSMLIVKFLTATTAQMATSWNNGTTSCGPDLTGNTGGNPGTTWTIYAANIAPFWWDGALGNSWYQDCVGSKIQHIKVDMNGVAGAFGYFTMNCQERTEGLDFTAVHQTCVGTNGCTPSGWVQIANTSTKGQLPFTVPVGCTLFDGSLAPGTGGWTPSASLWSGSQCGVGAGAGGANTFCYIYEGTNIISNATPKINAGAQKLEPGTCVGKSGHLIQNAVALNGVEGFQVGNMHFEYISDDVIAVGSDNNPTGDISIAGGFMTANTIASTTGTAVVHFYPSASGNCSGNFSNLSNGFTFLRDDHYGYVPPPGTGGANSVQGQGQLMTPPYCQPGTFGWGSSTYFANAVSPVAAALTQLGATTTLAKVWGLTIPDGQFVTFTKIHYSVVQADNSTNTYNLGIYMCTTGAGCASGAGTGTLMADTGTLAGTTFAPAVGLTGQTMINANAPSLGVTTLPPGSYYLALTTNTVSPPLELAGFGTAQASVNWLTATTAGNLTVTTGGTLPATVSLPATLVSIPNSGSNTPWISLDGAVVP